MSKILKENKNMITLNGKKFARNDEEMINSLFDTGGTCVGYYRVNKRSITLLDHQKTKVGVICNDVLATATKLDNGKWWYSYGKPDIIGEYLSYSQEKTELQELRYRFNLPIKY